MLKFNHNFKIVVRKLLFLINNPIIIQNNNKYYKSV